MSQKWQSNISSTWLTQSEQLRDKNGKFAKEEDVMQAYYTWKPPAGYKLPKVIEPQLNEQGEEDLLKSHLSPCTKAVEKYISSPKKSIPNFYLNSAPGGITRR